MLFYGPPGTGKTTVALVVGRRLFGSSFKERVMELNASDDRGIDVVRNAIKNRASRQCSATEDIPDFQLIILDEADCMTSVCNNQSVISFSDDFFDLGCAEGAAEDNGGLLQ